MFFKMFFFIKVKKRVFMFFFLISKLMFLTSMARIGLK